MTSKGCRPKKLSFFENYNLWGGILAKERHPSGWSIAIFILAVIVAILGLVKADMANTFLLLSIFLMSAAAFIRTH